MNFEIDNLHPVVKNNVIKILKELNISLKKVGLCGSEGNFPLAEFAAVKIMESAGIPFEYCNYALNGIPPKGCDTELSEKWNWSVCYDGAMLLYAIELANSFFTNATYYEVGMKYPVFKAELLIKKYKLEYVTTTEPEWSKKNEEQDRKTYYEVWQDIDKKYTFSFEKGRMGQGGYAGLVVRTMKDAVAFCKWYLAKKSFYVKDLDLFRNGLGGLNISELNLNKLL